MQVHQERPQHPPVQDHDPRPSGGGGSDRGVPGGAPPASRGVAGEGAVPRPRPRHRPGREHGPHQLHPDCGGLGRENVLERVEMEGIK